MRRSHIQPKRAFERTGTAIQLTSLFALSLGFQLVGTGAAQAAPLPGRFGGGASTIAANLQAGTIGLKLRNSAHEACPCRGTYGKLRQSATVSVDAGSVLTAAATSASATSAKTSKDASSSDIATITGLSMFGGLITADALTAQAAVSATATTLTPSDTGTTFTNLVIGGTPVDPGVADNTVIPISGIGSATVKAVQTSASKNHTQESVDMLEINVSQTNSFGLPVGATLVVGHALASFDRRQPAVAVEGGARGLTVNASAGTELQEAAGNGAAVSIDDCTGTNGTTKTDSVANLAVPGLLSLGTVTNTVTGGPTGGATVVQTSSTAADLSLLGGLIGAKAITAAVQETSTGGTATPSFSASSFSGLTVLGLPIPGSVAPNTKITLPGLGYVVINEQITGGYSARVNGLHIVVTATNLLGLPVGAQIVVAHAAASARPF